MAPAIDRPPRLCPECEERVMPVGRAGTCPICGEAIESD